MDPCKAPFTLVGFLLQTHQSTRSTNCTTADDPNFFRDYAIREINALLWISLILITVLLLRKVTKLLRLWNKGRNIPGPPCPSFYGHWKHFSEENLTGFLSKSHEKYGSIVRLWLGPTQLLVSVNDPALVKEMLVKAEDKLPSTERAFRLAFGQSSLFASSFDKVQKGRESLAMHLNEKLLEKANSVPSRVVDCVMERIDSIMTSGVLDCRLFSQHVAFSMLGATLFGESFLAWSSATDYEELLMKIATDACFWASYGVPPFWKRGFWRYKRLCTKLKCLTQDIIQHCRHNYKLFGQMNQNPCNKTTNMEKETVVNATFSYGGWAADDIFSEELDGHLDLKEEPCGNITVVMFHGCLSTASLISNFLTRLVMHPEIQDKIYSEINMVCKKSTKLELHNVHNMKLLLASIYESARLIPAGPLLQRCSLKYDLNLKPGVTVPAGAILVVPMQLVQMDGSSWGSDARQFNPYRFLSNASMGSVLEPIMPFTGAAEGLVDPGEGPFVLNDPTAYAAFLPFGSGTRACVGQKFAILGIAKLFAHLLQHYEIRLQLGCENEPNPGINNSAFGLLPSPKIVFVRRNC